MAVVSFTPGTLAGGTHVGGTHGRGRAARSAEIREELKRLIMLGDLPSNAPLLELELAARFQCSQGSVREALLALQEEGLVNRQPHRGTRVSECTEAEAREMFRLRHAIETNALARALPRIDGELLDALKAHVQAMEQAAKHDDEFGLSELDRQFHRQLLAAADLPALDPILHRCLIHNQRFKMNRRGAVRDLTNTAKRHWTIIAAIEAGDRDAAIAAIGHHVATIVDPGPEIFPATDAEPLTTTAPMQTNGAAMPRPTPDMQAILDRLAAEDADLPDPTSLPAADGRAFAARRNERWQVDQPEMEEVREAVIPADETFGADAVPATLFRPRGAAGGTILFVHGGGFAFCSRRTHERFMRLLAKEAGHTVVGIDYRLAPEHPYPAGLNDTVAALRAVLQRPEILGLEPGPVIIAGDSAGANLALAATLREMTAKQALPAGCLLLYGTYAADFDTPSYADFAEGFGLTTNAMRRYWDWYTPDPAARTDPFAAPLLAPNAWLKDLPPLFLLTAEVDPLASDTLMLAQRLRALGRSDAEHMESGVVHGFLQMTPALAAARSAVKAAAQAASLFIDQANRLGRNT